MANHFGRFGFSLLLTIAPSFGQSSIPPTYEALTNAAASGGSFQFSGSGTIVVPAPVSFGLATTLDANGHAVTLSGGGASSILSLETNATLTLKGLALVDGLARGSEEVGAERPGLGGAIVNLGGALTLQACVLSNNVAAGATNKIGPIFGGTGPQPVGDTSAYAAGGAIWQVGGELTVEGSRFIGNRAGSSAISRAAAEGGAVYIKGAGALNISDTTFSENIVACGGITSAIGLEENAPSKGGAIYAQGTPAMIEGGEFRSNQSIGTSGVSYGGAIYHSGASLTVTNINLSHNISVGGAIPGGLAQRGLSAVAGAIYCDGDLVVASSSLLSNASAAGESSGLGSPAPAYGGAISSAGSVRIVNSTFAANQSFNRYRDTFGLAVNASEGGALYAAGTAAITNSTIVGHTNSLAGGLTNVVIIKNTLLANNRYTGEADPIVDAGHNLSSDARPLFTQSTSSNGVDPKLGPIGNYGGATPVFPLLAGSPAINAADDLAAPTTDQRGRTRPFGAHADIGAFESSPPYFVWGKIRGYIDSSTTITVGSETKEVDETGSYFLGPFEPPTVTATLAATNAVFRPNPWVLTIEADGELSGVTSFELHSITFDPSLSAPAFTLAGTVGEVWNVERSTGLESWTEVGNFTIPSSGLVNIPVGDQVPYVFMRGSYTNAP